MNPQIGVPFPPRRDSVIRNSMHQIARGVTPKLVFSAGESSRHGIDLARRAGHAWIHANRLPDPSAPDRGDRPVPVRPWLFEPQLL